jgi:hypothetical protein
MTNRLGFCGVYVNSFILDERAPVKTCPYVVDNLIHYVCSRLNQFWDFVAISKLTTLKIDVSYDKIVPWLLTLLTDEFT